MPAYNAEKYISESIDSVIAQTYTNWELVVVNDNSTDTTFSILENYSEQEPRMVVESNTSGMHGAANARNVALKLAKGEYIAFLDSDDAWEKDKLLLQVNTMKEKGYSASHSSYTRIDEVGDTLSSVSCMPLVKYKDQLKGNRIPNLTGIYKRSSIGLFLQNNIGHEDYDMWLDVLGKVDSVGIQKNLAKYRVSCGSLSSNKFRAAIWHYKILSRRADVKVPLRFYYFIFYIVNATLKRI
ncbi:hypothetical protein BCU75_10745 [Vibrio splendidus]|nr:hypothetical protein BCU75_10745 [Vibrio splendidus]